MERKKQHSGMNERKERTVAETLYGVMDIGTNSVRLMLAEASADAVQPVSKRVTTTRIGEQLHRTGLLCQAGMERTEQALSDMLHEAQAAGAGQIWAFATSAVRDAGNREEFLTRCEAMGLPVQVVSGEQEAMLGFLGALGHHRGPGRLIDIGGGSTEIVEGQDGACRWGFSVPVGCVRAKERYAETEEGLRHTRRWLRDCPVPADGGEQKAHRVFAKMKKIPGPVYAVGGTATTLASLAAGVTQSYEPRIITGRSLTAGEVQRVSEDMGRLTMEERRRIPVLGRRADLIRYGAAILLECMDELGVASVITSDADNL